MEKEKNLNHWEQWATTYGNQLRATTKCESIKRLELDSLLRQVRGTPGLENGIGLEIGCGNGFNGFVLLENCPSLKYVGLDFSPAMITNVVADLEANSAGTKALKSRCAFGVLDARKLSAPITVEGSGPNFVGSALKSMLPASQFDFVFTDRMLINLASPAEQLEVMEKISTVIKPGGLFLMLENDTVTHGKLNRLRETLGLPRRAVASYNIFIDEEKVITPFRKKMDLVQIDHVSALHDLMLYAVAPAASNGEVEYDSPLMKSLTDTILSMRDEGLPQAAGFGQNLLWVWKKR